MRVIIDLRSPSGAGLQGHEGRDESVALSLNKVLVREQCSRDAALWQVHYKIPESSAGPSVSIALAVVHS